MAKIRKRGSSYQIDYFDPHGKRVRRSFSKRKDAEAELGKRVSLIADGRYLDVKKDCITTFGEILEKYKDNYQDQASYVTGKRFYIKALSEHFGIETLLSNIRYVDLETFRNTYRNTLTKNQKIRSVATVNRVMSCMRHIFSKAVDWEMIERSPFDRRKSLILKENNKRKRYLDQNEIDSLLEACSTKVIEFPKNKGVKKITRSDPNYLREIVECAINTGMRRGEILSLKWDQIKGGLIYLTETKTSEPREIPINEALEDLFKRIRKRKGFRSKYVFTYRGKPVKEIKTAFKPALKRAGIEDFRFHDLRHTFASQLIMRGGGLKDVQELLGHKTITMTLRYSHLSEEHKKNAVNLLNGLTGNRPIENSMCHKTVTSLKNAAKN